jgi:hypothetical protein
MRRCTARMSSDENVASLFSPAATFKPALDHSFHLQNSPVVAPLELFIRMDLLSPESVENWCWAPIKTGSTYGMPDCSALCWRVGGFRNVGIVEIAVYSSLPRGRYF